MKTMIDAHKRVQINEIKRDKDDKLLQECETNCKLAVILHVHAIHLILI